jgi:hypothetical protein
VKSYVMDDGRWHHKFHQSWLNTFDLCNERARYEHLLEDQPDSDAAATGTAVHSTIEYALRARYEGLDHVPLDVLVEFFHHELDAMPYEHVKWKGDDAPHKFGELCVRNWYADVLPTLPFMGVELERKFRLPLIDDEHRFVELGGTIDYYADPLRDWKTSGRGEYEEWEYRRWAIQPTVYTWARYQLEVAEGRTPNLPMEFEYVVLGRHGAQRFTVTRTPEHWAWMHDKVLTAALLIEAELPEWPKQDNHALCSPKWCDAWAECKGKFFEGEAW